jgi:hypothetical protein
MGKNRTGWPVTKSFGGPANTADSVGKVFGHARRQP